MQAFAALCEVLADQTEATAQQLYLMRYLDRQEDPERGYAIAALTGDWRPKAVPVAALEALLLETMPAPLWQDCLRQAGNRAEAVALAWPGHKDAAERVCLRQIPQTLDAAKPAARVTSVAALLSQLTAAERRALLQLLSGRVAKLMPAHQVRQALAIWGGVEAGALAQLWHALTPPYCDLFAWLQGRGPVPQVGQEGGYIGFPAPILQTVPTTVSAIAALPRPQLWLLEGEDRQLSFAGGKAALYDQHGTALVVPKPLAVLARTCARDAITLSARQVAAAQWHKMGGDMPAKASIFLVHDLCHWNGKTYDDKPYEQRLGLARDWLERFADTAPLRLSPQVEAGFSAEAVLAELGQPFIRGLVCADADQAARTGLYVAPRQQAVAMLLYAKLGVEGAVAQVTLGFLNQGQWLAIAEVDAAEIACDTALLDSHVKAQTVERFGNNHRLAPGLAARFSHDGFIPAPRKRAGFSARAPKIHSLEPDADENSLTQFYILL